MRRSEFVYGGGAQEFNLNYEPTSIFQVFINGVLQLASTYSLDGFTVTISGTVLSEGAVVTIIGNGCGDLVNDNVVKIEIFEYTDSNTFTLEQVPNMVFLVFVNGNFLNSLDYSLSVDEITINLPLIEEDEVTVYYVVNGNQFVFINEAPLDGGYYARRNGSWALFAVDIDGGSPESLYLPNQVIDGGDIDG